MVTLVTPHYPSQPAVTSALPECLYGVLMNQEKVTLCSVLIGFQRRTLCSVVMMQITRSAAISHCVTTGGYHWTPNEGKTASYPSVVV